jgi:hypothetical protein
MWHIFVASVLSKLPPTQRGERRSAMSKRIKTVSIHFCPFLPTGSDRVPFFTSSPLASWPSSLKTAYITKPITEPTTATLKAEAVCSSETWVSAHNIIRCPNPQDHNVNPFVLKCVLTTRKEIIINNNNSKFIDIGAWGGGGIPPNQPIM